MCFGLGPITFLLYIGTYVCVCVGGGGGGE